MTYALLGDEKAARRNFVHRPSHRDPQSRNESQSVLTDQVFGNTYRMSITPKAIQDLLDEFEALKQKSKAGCALGTFCRDSVSPFGSLRGWKRRDSAIGPEDL
jgi:hypothetical protein